jgi:hypothetical protein
MDIHTLTFHPPAEAWLASARHHDRRVALAELAVDAVAGGDEPSLLALPAGFLRTTRQATRDALARSLLEISRRSEVSLVFGIDVAPESEWAPLADPAATFVYACEAGRPVLWPGEQVRATERERRRVPPEKRCLQLGAVQVGVLVAGEVFNGPFRSALAQGRPELLIVLAHAQASERWRPALTALGGIAPTVVVEQTLAGALRPGARAAGAQAPPGWSQSIVADTADMTLRVFRPPPSTVASAG